MMYLKNVTTLKFDENKCINCQRCVEVCPHRVFQMDQVVKMEAKDRCIECGACKMNCPTEAIDVNAGVGCASAVILNYLRKFKLLSRFFKKDCCE